MDKEIQMFNFAYDAEEDTWEKWNARPTYWEAVELDDRTRTAVALIDAASHGDDDVYIEGVGVRRRAANTRFYLYRIDPEFKGEEYVDSNG